MTRTKGDRLCVLITGVGGRSVGHQILHGLRLVRDKYRLVAVDAEPFAFGLYLAATRYLVPRADDPDYVPTIREIVEREQVDVLLPGTEPEVRVLAKQRDAFAETACRLIANPIEVVELCSHKGRLTGWLREHGFDTPRTSAAHDWRALADEVGFPLVAKPCTQTGGSRNVALLVDPVEVERYLAEAVDDVILQEYVATDEDEYTAGVLIAEDGSLIDSIVLHRKLIGLSLGVLRTVGARSYALSTGYSQGFVIRHELVQRRCEELARAIGARGPINIQCRLAENDIKVFEVHPRFSGTSSIRAEVGFNEPDVLIRNVFHGEQFGRLEYRMDVAAIRAFQHLIVPKHEMAGVRRILSEQELR